MFEQPVSSAFVYVLNNNDRLLTKMFDLFFLPLWMKRRRKKRKKREREKSLGVGVGRWSWACHLRMYGKTGYRELRDWSKMRRKNWKNRVYPQTFEGYFESSCRSHRTLCTCYSCVRPWLYRERERERRAVSGNSCETSDGKAAENIWDRLKRYSQLLLIKIGKISYIVSKNTTILVRVEAILSSKQQFSHVTDAYNVRFGSHILKY